MSRPTLSAGRRRDSRLAKPISRFPGAGCSANTKRYDSPFAKASARHCVNASHRANCVFVRLAKRGSANAHGSAGGAGCAALVALSRRSRHAMRRLAGALTPNDGLIAYGGRSANDRPTDSVRFDGLAGVGRDSNVRKSVQGLEFYGNRRERPRPRSAKVINPGRG
jgi:hypothetical protein